MLQCLRLLAAVIALLTITATGGDPCEARSGNPEPVPCLRVPRCPATASVDRFYVNTVPGPSNELMMDWNPAIPNSSDCRVMNCRLQAWCRRCRTRR